MLNVNTIYGNKHNINKYNGVKSKKNKANKKLIPVANNVPILLANFGSENKEEKAKLKCIIAIEDNKRFITI